MNVRKFELITNEDGYSEMVALNEHRQTYVRLEDFEELAEKLAIKQLPDPNITFNMEQLVRFMMIDTRLRKEIEEAACYEICCCPRCLFVYKVRDILNSEPPIGKGFVSEKGLALPHTGQFFPDGAPLATDSIDTIDQKLEGAITYVEEG